MELPEVRKKLVEGLAIIHKMKELQKGLTVLAIEIGEAVGEKTFNVDGILVSIREARGSSKRRWGFVIQTEVIEV